MLRLLLVVLVCAPFGGCKKATTLDLYVDGFLPEHVRFEVEDVGTVDSAALAALKRRPDIDGRLELSSELCHGPCRAAILSVFVHNRTGEQLAPPVVRIDAPLGKPRRQPITFRGKEIDPGRIGRIRWLVMMYPEEEALTATVSSSVFIVDAPPSVGVPPGGDNPARPVLEAVQEGTP